MALNWIDPLRCATDDVVFQAVPEDFVQSRPELSMDGADFLLVKPRPLIESYVELLDELRPGNIVELGVFEGAGTAFLLELTEARQLVGIDRRAPVDGRLEAYLAQRGLNRIVRIHPGVDQADRKQLAAIVDADFSEEPLDLVVDDCSHLYDPSQASFNELFPRLRPGGVYVIEDWAWAHDETGDPWPAEIPLTRLVFEVVLAMPGSRGLIASIDARPKSVWVTRGPARMDPQEFDIADLIDDRGRRLMGRDSR